MLNGHNTKTIDTCPVEFSVFVPVIKPIEPSELGFTISIDKTTSPLPCSTIFNVALPLTSSINIDELNINAVREPDETIVKNPNNLTSAKQATTFAISVLIHLLALIALVIASQNLMPIAPIEKKEVNAIKSYLYRAPKPASLKVEHQQEKVAETKSIDKKPLSKIIEPTKNEVTKKPVEVVKAEKTKQVQTITNKNKSAKNTTTKPVFSSRAQLQKLRNSINSQIMQKEFDQRTIKRSASIMHAPQIPVPHAVVPLTAEKKKQKTTSNFGGGTITKNDDGGCTIVREQFIGSPVEASVSGFACGESKFDKSFRQHMKKVQKKLTPIQ